MSGFGPQDERNSQYGKEADLGYPDNRSHLRGPQIAGATAALQAHNQRLQTTVEHLQQLVSRQEIVINDYQIKYPTASMAPSDIEQDATAVGLAPWVADPLAMSPLLIAYDERLNELQSSNTVLTEQVGKLKKSNDDVQAENGSLRADLKHYVERMLSYTEGSNGGLGGASTTSMAHGEQMNELAEMNDVLNQTNTIMSEQISMLESHLNTTKKELLDTKTTLETEVKSGQETNAALTQLSVMNRSLQMERDETVRRLQSCTSDLSRMQSSRDELAEIIRTHQNGNKLNKAQVEELKNALSEVAKAASEDQESLEARLHQLSELSREMKATLIAKESELDVANEDLRTLRAEHATTRTDAEGMLKVMTTLESQLSEYAGREESTMSIAREAKEKVEQAMLERDQAVAREAQGRREIARLLEQRRGQAAAAMGHEEQSLKETRGRLELQLKSRDDSITKLGSRCAELQAKMERSARDQRTATVEREALMKDVETERTRLRDTIDEFGAKTKEAVERRDRAEAQTLSTTQDLAEKEQEMALVKTELNDRLAHLQERMADLTKENSVKTSEIKRLETEMRNTKNALSKERRDGQTQRQVLQEEASRVTETAAKQVADIQSRLDKGNREHADGQASTASLLAAHERRSSTNIRQLQDSVSNHQRMVREKTEECARANSRAIQLEQQLTVAIAGQQDLEQQMLHITRAMETVKEQKVEATKKHKNAASRMSGLIQSEETRLRQLSEGRMENARLNREVQRLEQALGRKQNRGNSRSPTRA